MSIGQFAYANKSNRSCLLRSVEGRLEWCMPDPVCNIYAALSGVIAAGLDGIDHAMQAPPACEEDLYERFAQDLSMPEQLPTSLQAATQGLAQNTRLQAAVGEAFCEQVLLLQREQWRKWQAHVTGWEWQQYGDFYE